MKYILLSFCFTILTMHNISAQSRDDLKNKLSEFNNDTVRYIKEYVLARKELYIGKSFDSLINDMPLPIRRCVNEVNPSNMNYSAFTIFYFYKNFSDTAKFNFVITWGSRLNKLELETIGVKRIGGVWSDALRNFYRGRIISDFVTY